MKKTIYTILAFLTLNMVSYAQSKDEKAVASAVEKLKEAMISGNRQNLEAIAAPELSYGHSGGKIENRAEFVDAIANGSSDFVSIDLADQTIKIAGNAAIVRHNLSAKTNDGGKPGVVNLRILLVWQKQNGEWKLLARQAVKI